MKHLQTKFHADPMRHSIKVIRSKKSPDVLLGQNLSLGQNFLAAEFFLVIDILLKLQQHILICFCKFSCNSEILMGLLRLLT